MRPVALLLAACAGQETFSPEAWSVASPERRRPLAWDLEDRGLLPGRTADEVRALLGPDDTTCFLGADPLGPPAMVRDEPTVLIWDLGLDAWFPVTRIFLYLDLRDGRVVTTVVDDGPAVDCPSGPPPPWR